MNKILRGTLEVKTEVLDQNAISDSSDPLREVARHVSTPSLAWTKSTAIISHYQRSSSFKSVKLDRTNLIQPNRIFIRIAGKWIVKIPGECRVPLFLEYRFLIPRLTENVTIYCTELADLRRWTSGVLPNEQPGLNWTMYDGHNPGIL